MVQKPNLETVDVPTDIQTDVYDPQITPDDAYRIYVTTGARSLRRTADLLRMKHGTILSWSQRYGWAQRIRDTDLEITEGIADAAAAAVVRQQLANIEYLTHVRDNDELDVKDRTKATAMLMGEFKDISKAVGERLNDTAVEDMEEAELERLSQTDEGVSIILARQRARIGAI